MQLFEPASKGRKGRTRTATWMLVDIILDSWTIALGTGLLGRQKINVGYWHSNLESLVPVQITRKSRWLIGGLLIAARCVRKNEHYKNTFLKMREV